MTISSIYGSKHTCAGCESRFYDLAKSPATCPLCKKVVVVVMAKASKRTKRSVPEACIDHESDAQVHAVTVVAPKYKGVKWR